jgi:hypothetical protein
MKFNIKVKRTVEHTAEFEVEALNEGDAEAKAIEKIEGGDKSVVWDDFDTEYELDEPEEVEDDDETEIE